MLCLYRVAAVGGCEDVEQKEVVKVDEVMLAALFRQDIFVR